MNYRVLWLLFFSVSMAVSSLHADVTLPDIFGSNMVLQRGMPVAVFGTADPGEKVAVRFNGSTKSTQADAKGSWKLFLDPMKANAKGQTVTISGKNVIELKNVLVGEVWLGSGQSNMQWPVRRSKRSGEAFKTANNPNIRLFKVPTPKTRRVLAAKKKEGDSKKKGKNNYFLWEMSDRWAVNDFSAVLFYFGAKLHRELNVPIGLIQSGRGASGISSWKVDGGLYKVMVLPLTPITLRGVTWYQGEADVMKKRGLKYTSDMTELIDGWRKAWSRPKLPFYYVQIAPWSNKRYPEGQLPALLEAQAAALKIPNTGMAVVTDTVLKLSNIHPSNKLPVGERLALWALAKNYGKDVVYSGPLFKAAKVEGRKIRIHFAHAKGLASRGEAPLNEFKIAGADGTFVDAKAEIDGETIIVSAESVKAPKTVRFGWHNTAQPNLVNGAGLPASPFQTDSWKGGTGEESQDRK